MKYQEKQVIGGRSEVIGFLGNRRTYWQKDFYKVEISILRHQKDCSQKEKTGWI